MERYNLAVITRRIFESGFLFFSAKTLRDLLEVQKESTLFDLLKRLTESRVLIKIERGKYILGKEKINDFTLANLIYQPSYISFESALNFNGVISQFPYEITSATPKKTREKVIEGRVFRFIHIQKNLFWGYEKKNGFIIAFPEKALLDLLYVSAKGQRRVNLDEYNFREINRKKLKDYLKKYPETRQFKSIAKKLKEHIHK